MDPPRHHPADVQQFLIEREIVAMHRIVSDLLGARVEFTHPATDQAERMAELFDVYPQFDCAHTVFGIDPSLLYGPCPKPTGPPAPCGVARCRDLLNQRRARAGIAAEVRELLLFNSGATGSTRPAARHRRTQTRSQLPHVSSPPRGRGPPATAPPRFDEVRRTLAEEMLAETPADHRRHRAPARLRRGHTFIFAFKRWTGTTPATRLQGRTGRGPLARQAGL
ncbi:AraC family transcriptional regulator ligand-binding domain-containing protein [Nocardia coffeae]|uniref:AraC family transcriptional regulator ligand-binding domain-containing protein n=1 Tax=Nocardia coffeae TaxID=2873381 RepID=UPI0035578114